MLVALVVFARSTPAIPNAFVGEFAPTVSHGLSADLFPNFTSAKISSSPFAIQATIFSERVVVTFHDGGKSGSVHCFGSDAPFRFLDDPPFYSTSVQLPHDLTIRLSLLSFSSFHVIALRGGAAVSLTFAKDMSFFEKIRPLFNARILLFVVLVVAFPVSLSVVFSPCKAAIQARLRRPKAKTE
jgi:hypothetical protein